jgi:hypothetical protein
MSKSTEDAMADQTEPEQLAAFISRLQAVRDFELLPPPDAGYNHIGAILADAVLQANNNYERNVRGRIGRIRREFATETTLKALRQRLSFTSPQTYLDWKGTRKPTTFLALIELLEREGVNTEDDLRRWLQSYVSKDKLLAIRFVGPKTVNYLQILVGLEAVAVDVRLNNFIALAGLPARNFARAEQLFHGTADLMNVPRSSLDYSVWFYMGKAKSAITVTSARCLSP